MIAALGEKDQACQYGGRIAMAWRYRYVPAVQMNGTVHITDPPSQAKCYRAISDDALTE